MISPDLIHSAPACSAGASILTFPICPVFYPQNFNCASIQLQQLLTIRDKKRHARSGMALELVKKVFLTSSQTRSASLGSRLKELRDASVFCLTYTPPDKTDLQFIRACERELCEAFRQAEFTVYSAFAGSRTVKRQPPCGRFSARTLPPFSSTIFFTSARPSPFPSASREVSD